MEFKSKFNVGDTIEYTSLSSDWGGDDLLIGKIDEIIIRLDENDSKELETVYRVYDLSTKKDVIVYEEEVVATLTFNKVV